MVRFYMNASLFYSFLVGGDGSTYKNTL